MDQQIIECVPNFSEGQNPIVLNAIKQAIVSVTGVKLLHIDSGIAANRTVFTFVGSPQQVIEAAFLAIESASRHIDMRNHKGEHPRIGATDVCPLVPIQNISLEQTAMWALKLAERVSRLLHIPVYLYEANAVDVIRRNLAKIRKGEYEGLEAKMQEPQWLPDFPCNGFNAKSGATVIGARNFLIAYNVNLNTKDAGIAQQIAEEIRDSGRMVQNLDGTKTRIRGILPTVKAIGWYIKDFDIAQISLNVTNINTTPLHVAFETCKVVAKMYGLEVTGSELIGLIPKQALLDAGRYYANESSLSDYELMTLAIERLNLRELEDFVLEERII
jgi:glutamate formiminotransferase / formiminotetrahydrofolate cyclodeaminase